MAKHPRYGLALGIFLFATVPGIMAGPRSKGYLVSVGPAPLRFREPRPVVVAAEKEGPSPQSAVPVPTPMPMPGATNQLAVPSASEPTNEAPLESAGYSPEVASPPEESPDYTISPWMQDTQDPTGVEAGPVNPQTVTSYLTPGPTNAEPLPGRGRIPLPAFVPPIPPLPPAPRSSQATYESH
jgi:hypothetical protein